MMNKLNKLKDEYESIKPSEAFSMKMKKIIKNKKGYGNMSKKILGFGAGIAAAFVLTFNLIPGLAAAASDVPVLGSVIKVITFGRFEVHDNGYDANIVTPQIEGLLDKALEDKLNNEFKENARSIILAFENDVKTLKEEYGDEDVHFGIDANYSVKTDNDDILAIDTYIVNTVGSSSTIHKFYNIDKKNGRLITLNSLFKDGADYVTPISLYIADEMDKINKNENGAFFIGQQEEGFEKIKEDQNFYINNNGNVVICFDKYEVSAGAQGCPEFEIPNDLIKDILR